MLRLEAQESQLVLASSAMPRLDLLLGEARRLVVELLPMDPGGSRGRPIHVHWLNGWEALRFDAS